MFFANHKTVIKITDCWYSPLLACHKDLGLLNSMLFIDCQVIMKVSVIDLQCYSGISRFNQKCALLIAVHFINHYHQATITGKDYCHSVPIRDYQAIINKANLRDLIAVTGLVISNWIQIVNFSARGTVKFDGWPRKTIGHFFYTTSSFVHHFKSIGEFKLDLQSRNAQFGSKLVMCYPAWSWNLMDDLGKQ